MKKGTTVSVNTKNITRARTLQGTLQHSILDQEANTKSHMKKRKLHRPIRQFMKWDLFRPLDQQYVWNMNGKAYDKKNTIFMDKLACAGVLQS